MKHTNNNRINYQPDFPIPMYSVEQALIWLQLEGQVFLRLTETTRETTELICLFTKSLAVKPDRQREASFSFCAESARAPKKVNPSTFAGLLAVWQQQLCQMNQLSEPVAKALIERYPSPSALVAAFKAHGVHAVENVPVRRGSSNRRVGPKMSERLHNFFMTTDPDMIFE
eukprot:m.61819 g.61819  ORF g.61819 m.61819 type:complete len:171 (+) comp19305_c1_seq1:219-731(+)